MIKHLPEHWKEYLLEIYNTFFQESFFPERWRRAIVVPILKPQKDGSSADNYRPIALTSCVYKLFERIINNRLVEFLNLGNFLSNVQCGCMRTRSSMDHLVRLEREVRTAFANNEHFISIFFDLEKAYDMTWRQGILRNLHNAGIRGLLPKYIECFLKLRVFRVRLANYFSDLQSQENGVPQGSILSVALFALKVNSVTSLIPSSTRFISSLYVDDLEIGFRHPDLNEVESQLQSCLHRIYEWTNYNGFKFSVTKSRAVHFTTLPGLHLNKPTLKLGTNVFPYVNQIKNLRLIWDSKLTWRAHISQLKADCTKLVGMLRGITKHEWGADMYCTMKI